MFEDTLKNIGPFVIAMVCWDIIRMFLQAKVNSWIINRSKMGETIKDIAEDVDEITDELGEES